MLLANCGGYSLGKQGTTLLPHGMPQKFQSWHSRFTFRSAGERSAAARHQVGEKLETLQFKTGIERGLGGRLPELKGKNPAAGAT